MPQIGTYRFLNVLQAEGEYRTFSNFLAMVLSKANGAKNKVQFSRNELREARQIFRGLLRLMIDFKRLNVC
jgi:hypothetical protein